MGEATLVRVGFVTLATGAAVLLVGVRRAVVDEGPVGDLRAVVLVVDDLAAALDLFAGATGLVVVFGVDAAFAAVFDIVAGFFAAAGLGVAVTLTAVGLATLDLVDVAVLFDVAACLAGVPAAPVLACRVAARFATAGLLDVVLEEAAGFRGDLTAVGLVVVGLAAVDLAVVGLAVVGLAVVDREADRFVADGFDAAAFEAAGFVPAAVRLLELLLRLALDTRAVRDRAAGFFGPLDSLSISKSFTTVRRLT